jgi:hypothetical protein
MWQHDWLDRLHLWRGVLHLLHLSDLILMLLRLRKEAVGSKMHPLDRLILRETTIDILHSLRPRERAIAVLRLEGLNDGQIGRILGIERSSVSWRMKRAQQRIMAQVPGAANLLAGCERPRGGPPAPDAPLERGWICAWGEEALEVDAEPAGSLQQDK